MAMRGGPSRRLVGNRLGGVLRDLDRQTRRTTRRGRVPGPAEGQEGVQEAAAAPRPPSGPVRAPSAVSRAVVRTGEDGRARWPYREPYAVAPVLTALPVGPVPVVPVLEEVAPDHAVVRAWTLHGSPAAGVELHLTARPV